MTRTGGARARDRAAMVVGGVVLVWSLVRPTVREMERNGRAEAAAADVAAVAAAVAAYVDDRGEAPPGDEAGRAPGALTPWLADGVRFAGDGWRLDLDRWTEAIVPAPPPDSRPRDSVPSPPPIRVDRPVLSVHSRHPDLLAHLLDAYGPSVSFVRDTSWTLVLDPVIARESTPRTP